MGRKIRILAWVRKSNFSDKKEYIGNFEK